MRLLLSHPYAWPYVRRGAEREVHDLGVGLLSRGHRVRLLASAPLRGVGRRTVEGLPTTFVPLPPHRLPGRLGRGLAARYRPSDVAPFALPAAVRGLAATSDVALAFHYPDAAGLAAAFAARRRLGRRTPRLVLKMTGVVIEERVRSEPIDDRLVRAALRGADEVWVNSRFVAEAMASFGVPMHIVPAPVDLERFTPPPGPRRLDVPPIVLCTSAPGDPRKRLVDLVRAWPEIAAGLPGARLRLAGAIDAAARTALFDELPPERRGDVELLGLLGDDALVEAYRGATCVVAPAVYEALGLTTIEALACGTPVAGARSGATTELLADPAVGTLFEPVDPASCAAAVVGAAALAQDPTTAAACRASTLRYGTAAVLDEVERRLGGLGG